MSDARLSAAQMKQLREEDNKERKVNVASRFRSLVKEAEALPMRVKTQYPAYLEVGMLHVMKGVAEAEGISVQALIRTAIQDRLDKLMRATKGGGAKKRAPSKKRA